MIVSGGADVHEVVDAARRRADALAAGDSKKLEALLHPALRWTTFTGDVLTRKEYVAANTGGGLTWRSQRLEDPVVVVVVADTAVLTAVATDEVRREGHDETYRLRLTQTWVRTETGWQCLAGHAGPLV